MMKDKVKLCLSVIVSIAIIAIAVMSIPECDNGTIVGGLLWLECIR